MSARFLSALLFFVPALLAVTPPPGYAGHWKGGAVIGVTFVRQTQLNLDLVIHPDGSVTGKIGDAYITSGGFREHTWLEKFFGNHGYVLKVDLDGDLVATEQFHRRGAYVIVNLDGGLLTGGLNSYGGEGFPFPGMAEYNRRHMAVSCRKLRLEKQTQ